MHSRGNAILYNRLLLTTGRNNVSSKKKSLDSLPVRKLTEKSFEALLESAPDAMIVIDDSGRIVIVNGEAEKMFGYGRDDMHGEKIEMLLPHALHERHIAHRNRYMSNPNLRPMGLGLELNGRRRDGEEFPVEISLSPIHTKGGAFVSSVIRDVTSRKKMEQALVKARKDAERANLANSAFLAAASHDLRQPVQALSLLNGALRRTVTDAKALEMLESQNQSLTAMTNLLNSLLDISRLDAGAITPNFEGVPIRWLVGQLSPEFARQAIKKGLSFESEMCDGIVRTDPNMLTEIISNFVSNGIRYTENGTVTLVCEKGEKDCCVRVCDTGIGIKEDQLDDIFKEFHQCKEPGFRNEGFGLGLAIVRRLADLLGHKVDVNSAPGKGSCFSITLPLVDAADKASVSGAAAETSENLADVSGRVILIEDDVQVSSALTLLLEAEGYSVASAATMHDATAITASWQDDPDLIVSDYHLADSSTGVEAIAAIRSSRDAEIPALIITGDTSRVVAEAKNTANCVLLNKPVDPDHLLELARAATTTGRLDEV